MSETTEAYVNAIRDAWREFKESVGFQTFCLSSQGCDEDEPHLPLLHAWLYAVWKSVCYRFTPYNLERLFRPLKAERRQALAAKSDYVFWCGAEDTDDAWWAEVDALVAEFGGPFPPRDWQPVSAAEAVGMSMGMSREEVAEIVAA